MRLIDADALMKQIESPYTEYSIMIHLRRAIKEFIDSAPSIDAVSVVRCKECKHNPWNTDADYTCIWDDDFSDREQTPDDFCSYGEREGE